MILGFVTAWYMYIRSPETPKYLAEQHRGLYQFLLNKWYFDETLLTSCSFVLPSGIGTLPVEGGRWPRSSTATARTALPLACMDVTDRVVRLQTGYLYHYAFVMLIGVAALVDLDDARELLLMTDWPILSAVTFLPLVGVALLLLTREDSASGRRNILNISLLTTVVHLPGIAAGSGGISTIRTPVSRWSRSMPGSVRVSPTISASTASRCCSWSCRPS